MTIVTVSAAKELHLSTNKYELYVFCSNTYNWYPDWSISRFIETQIDLKEKKVVAITLGTGSTSHSQKTLEILIKNKGGNLVDSKSFWLWKPNNDSKNDKTNVKKALEMAKLWALKIINS